MSIVADIQCIQPNNCMRLTLIASCVSIYLFFLFRKVLYSLFTDIQKLNANKRVRAPSTVEEKEWWRKTALCLFSIEWNLFFHLSFSLLEYDDSPNKWIKTRFFVARKQSRAKQKQKRNIKRKWGEREIKCNFIIFGLCTIRRFIFFSGFAFIAGFQIRWRASIYGKCRKCVQLWSVE